MLEFYYDFLDKYFGRQDLELRYMDTDSFYLAMRGDSLDEIVRPEMKQAYEADKKNWLATDKFSESTRLIQAWVCRHKRCVAYCKVLPCSK